MASLEETAQVSNAQNPNSIDNLSKPLDVLSQDVTRKLSAELGSKQGFESGVGNYNSSNFQVGYTQNAETLSFDAQAGANNISSKSADNKTIINAQATSIMTTKPSTLTEVDYHRLFVGAKSEGNLSFNSSKVDKNLSLTALAGHEATIESGDKKIVASIYAGARGSATNGLNVKPAFVSGANFQTSFRDYVDYTPVEASLKVSGAEVIESGEKNYVGRLQLGADILNKTNTTSLFTGIEANATKIYHQKAEKVTNLYTGFTYKKDFGNCAFSGTAQVNSVGNVNFKTSIGF